MSFDYRIKNHWSGQIYHFYYNIAEPEPKLDSLNGFGEKNKVTFCGFQGFHLSPLVEAHSSLATPQKVKPLLLYTH